MLEVLATIKAQAASASTPIAIPIVFVFIINRGVKALAMTRPLRRSAPTPAHSECEAVLQTVQISSGNHVLYKPKEIDSIVERILATECDVQIIIARNLRMMHE